MSEYQAVAFRAIDGPVSEKNLEYMERQSSRAEITPWTFDNEYHYGDFRGNALEMLRRGYDFYLHYANFGVRRLMFRLPEGLPDATAARPYLDKGSLVFTKDKSGPGGTLKVEPGYESGDLDELWDLDQYANRLLPLRNEILQGDLRPLYLMRLGVATDMNHDPDEEAEPPVPAGMRQLTDAQEALAEFYGIGDSLLVAAGESSPDLADAADLRGSYAAWLARKSVETKEQWLLELMTEENSNIRRRVLSEYRKKETTSGWPTAKLDRTIADLLARADVIRHDQDRKAKEAAARKRAKHLTTVARHPDKTLGQIAKTFEEEKRPNYDSIAQQLADLRDALAASNQADLAENEAARLKERYPSRNGMIQALRKQGFLQRRTVGK